MRWALYYCGFFAILFFGVHEKHQFIYFSILIMKRFFFLSYSLLRCLFLFIIFCIFH